ncbi:non-ribosomal peptide synthetase [Pedobacter sp. PWIIR3]
MISTTVHLIEIQSQQTPGKTAISYEDERLSYEELNKKANQLSALLKANGVARGTVVGIAVDRSIEMVVSLLAIFKAGAAYVPLDPEYPDQRLEYMLSDSKAQFLLTNGRYQNDLHTDAKIIIMEDAWNELDKYPQLNPAIVQGDDLAYILYTSGSTGLPKGVMITQSNLLNLIKSVQKFPGLTEKDRLLSLTTISFDISVLELFLPLTVGATLFITDAELAKDGEAILKLIDKESITFMQATPATYKMMIAAEWEKRCDIKAICCGEQLPKDLAENILSRCARLYNMYGPTETTIYSTGKEILESDAFITIGKPIDNTIIHVLDEQQQTVSDGEIGEICIGGAGVSIGYFGNTELTDKKFFDFQQPDGNGIRLYRTGDLGKILANGEIQCFGRIDHQIKIRGYRIEVGEIEYFLKQQPDIREALVVAWEGPTGDTRLAAYIVPEQEISQAYESENIARWKNYLRRSIPFYMVPNDFVLIDKLPLNASQKIDRKSLPLPSLKNTPSPPNDAIPRNESEILIARLWADQLGIDDLGIHDNFFDLGGHSLSAVKVIVQIKKETGKYLPLGSLFKYPTIAELAGLLKDNKKSTFESLVPIKPYGSKKPLYIIHGLGATVFKFWDFAHQLDIEQPVYGLQARGLDGIEEPARTIPEMAAQYVSEIIAQNPDGPYLLSGYSMGGLIAFEMTKQLEKAGKKVAILAMFDTFIVKNNQLDEGLYKSAHWISARVAKFFYTFYLLALEPKRTIDHKVFMINRAIKKLRGLEAGNENGLDEDFTIINKLNKVHEIAEKNYKLSYYDKEIHLFKAAKASRYMNDFKYLGWKPYVKKVNIHIVEGDHITMFDEQYIGSFAASLQALLDKAAS